MTLADKALSRLLRLPAATSDYAVDRDVPVPMRDGVTLLADHYVPTGTPRGTLLVRSPYGRAGAWGLLYARPYAQRGFHVVVQSCRATFGSGGEVNAFAGEVEDGADTVAWLRTQPWFTGTFATLGLSYLGFNEWALLMDPPPELKAAIMVSAPHDAGRLLFGSGAFALQSAVGWCDAVLHQEDHGPVRGAVTSLLLGARRNAPALNALPLGSASDTVFGGRAPWYDRWLTHPDHTDDFWQSGRFTEALQRAEVPVLLYSGWQDLILGQTLEQVEALAARGVDTCLTVGPWNHGELLSKASGVIVRETLAWLSEHLVGDGKRLNESPVRICVTGADGWRDLAAWPPPTREHELFLHPAGVLAGEAPDVEAAPSQFRYDPSDPTPMVGGLTNMPTAGSKDNTAREARSDVLTFTGPILTSGLEVIGSPVVELAHTSDNPFADVFVRLCEVDAKGRSFNICEAYVRLSAPVEGPLRLELSATAHLFAAGSRLRLQVSGGSHPQYDRNLGTGEPLATGWVTRPSHRTIAHGRGGVSKLVLPVSAES